VGGFTIVLLTRCCWDDHVKKNEVGGGGGQLTCHYGEEKNCEGLVEESQGCRSLGRPSEREEDNIKIDKMLKE
jgi:hypothetical protein